MKPLMSARGMLLAFLALVALAPWLLPEFQVTLLNYVGLYALVALGLVLLTGFGGLTSFGQAAFVGLGAYTTAVLTTVAPLPGWLAFHAGSTVTEERQNARFAFVEKGAMLPNLCLFAQGTQEYPDRSTTLVVEIEGFEGGRPMVLTGPGIRTREEIAPVGLPDMFPHFWTENRQGFPRGVDLVLIAGDRVLCLPRTTVVHVKEA